MQKEYNWDQEAQKMVQRPPMSVRGGDHIDARAFQPLYTG